MIWTRRRNERWREAVFHTLRPYGGVACAWGSLADRSRIEEIVQDEAFPGASVREAGDFVLLARSGSLPGAADWSHAEANAASTGASEDEFIRSPMAVLWFDAAQRWHKYPGQVQVRVAGGRLVLFEEGVLRASDVYTGRKLWEVEVPLGAKPLTDPLAREAVRYARHRQWGPAASLASTTQLVVDRGRDLPERRHELPGVRSGHGRADRTASTFPKTSKRPGRTFAFTVTIWWAAAGHMCCACIAARANCCGELRRPAPR